MKTLLLVLLLLLTFGTARAQTARQLNIEAVELLQKNSAVEARDLLREALRMAPDDPVIRANYASSLLMAGFAELKKHRFSEAAELFLEGQTFASADARFWLYRAHALMELGETSLAEIELGSALVLAPDDPAIHRLRGQLFYNLGRLDEALDSLRKAKDLDPDDQRTVDLLEKVKREYLVERDMRSDYGGQFTISYDSAQHAEVGSQLLDVLEDAFVEIGSWFNSFPDIKVPVLVYTRQDFSAITGSPAWAGASYDGKIRIPLGGMTRMTPHLRSVLYHEYAHVLVKVLTSGHCPTWLNEGIAELAARSQFDPPLVVLSDAAATDRLFDFADLEKSLLTFSPDQARLAYEQSYSLVSFLVDYFGWYKLSDLLAFYSQGLSTDAAFLAAFRDYGLGFSEIEQQWRRSLD